jgi:hypothetical protein
VKACGVSQPNAPTLSAAVAVLRAQYGEANARMVAPKEEQKARRARLKTRFAFWADVVGQIESGNCNNAANTQPAARGGPAGRL